MASLRSTELRFFDWRDDRPLDEPIEWTPAWLALNVAIDQWDRLSVSLDGASLTVQLRRTSKGEKQIACEWPRVGAGRHRVVLSLGVDRNEYVVRVPPKKLTAQAMGALVEELESVLPSELAIAMQRMGALAGMQIVPPSDRTLSGERLRLQKAIEGTQGRRGIPALLKELSRAPHHVLQPEERWVRAEQARSPDPRRLHTALLRAGNVGADGLVEVVDRRVLSSMDTYENRLVRAFVREVRVRTAVYAGLCDALGAGCDREEANQWLRALALSERETPWLQDVNELSVAPSRVTMVLMKRPAYREALEGFLALHRNQSVRLDCDELASPLENLPSLYQTWGTLQVVLATLEVAHRHGYRVKSQRLVRGLRGSALVRVLPDGEAALELVHENGTNVRVFPERTYGERGVLRSVSFPQRPDVAIEVRRGEQLHVWIFDPKYKLESDRSGELVEGRPVKADVDKMHAYRDAIRSDSGSRVVAFAATLYPGPSVGYGGEVAALHASPGASGVLRAEVRSVLEKAL